MHRRALLRSIPCDLKELPIGALEAFVLSQVHGRVPVEEVAEATGIALDDLLRVVQRLVDLGALEVDDPKSKTRRPRALPRTERPVAVGSVQRTAASLVPPSVIPVPRPCPDVRSLGIGPREGFVLSQIDGATSTADLSIITHLSSRELSDALDVLEAVGAIDLPHRRRSKPPTARFDEAAHSSIVEAAHSSIDEAARGSVDEGARGSIDEAARGSVDESARGSVDESARDSVDEGARGAPVEDTADAAFEHTAGPHVEATVASSARFRAEHRRIAGGRFGRVSPR